MDKLLTGCTWFVYVCLSGVAGMPDIGGEAVGDCLDIIMETFFVSFDPDKDPELRLRFDKHSI